MTTKCRLSRLLGNAGDGSHHSAYLEQDVIRHAAQVSRLADSPIEAPHVLAKNDPMNGQSWWQLDLKLVALYLARNGAGICN